MKAADLTRPWVIGQNAAKIMRPANTRLSLIIFIATAMLTRLSPAYILLGAGLIVCCYGVVVTLNDLADVAIDKSNNRDLPLAKDRLSRLDAKLLLVFLSVTIVLFCFTAHSFLSSLFAVLFCSLGWAYSAGPLRISHRGVLATFLLALYYVVLPFILGVRQGAQIDTAQKLLICLSLFCIGCAYLFYKDFKDEKGDRAYGKRTPLVRYGSARVKAISLCFGSAGLLWAIVLSNENTLTSGAALFSFLFLFQQYKSKKVSQLILHLYAIFAFLALLPVIK